MCLYYCASHLYLAGQTEEVFALNKAPLETFVVVERVLFCVDLNPCLIFLFLAYALAVLELVKQEEWSMDLCFLFAAESMPQPKTRKNYFA